MITIRKINPSEMDGAKLFIRKIFPNAIVQINDGDTIVIAENNGNLVGFAHIIDEDDRIVLQGLGVKDTMRGQGVGTILLEHIIDSFDDGVRPFYLKVKAMNPVIDLYSRYGFFIRKFGDSHVLIKKSNS